MLIEIDIAPDEMWKLQAIAATLGRADLTAAEREAREANPALWAAADDALERELERRGESPLPLAPVDELAQRRRLPTIEKRVERLVKRGMCDADIAAATNHTPKRISEIRRSLHLKANPRYRRRTA
jgi:hypothetical protein